MKKKVLLSVLLILICTFTACGKKDRKDIEKDLGGNTTENTGTSEETVQEEIPEHLSYTVSGTTVDAEVSADGYGQLPVYKVKKKEKNDDWIRSYAELLFDGGEYVNVKPYQYCSKAELEAEKQFWEEELSGTTDEEDRYPRIQQEIAKLEYEIEVSADRDAESYPADKLIFENEDSDEVGTYHTEDTLLRGEVDGDTWQLIYDYRKDEMIIEGETVVDEPAPILYGICLKKAKYYKNAYGIDAGIYNNLCSRATAEADAEKLLDRLGFYDMEQLSVKELNPRVRDQDGNYGRADYCDGYVMVYAPAFGNVKPSMNMVSTKAYNIDETDTYGTTDSEFYAIQPEIFAIQPCVSIFVNSEGIFSFCIIEDYEIEETLTVNPSMLTFEQIDSIAKAKFEKMGDKGMSTVAKVNFGYMYITYDGISYAVVPVWSYCVENTYMADKTYIPLLNICALDGAIIETTFVNCDFEYAYCFN